MAAKVTACEANMKSEAQADGESHPATLHTFSLLPVRALRGRAELRAIHHRSEPAKGILEAAQGDVVILKSLVCRIPATFVSKILLRQLLQHK